MATFQLDKNKLLRSNHVQALEWQSLEFRSTVKLIRILCQALKMLFKECIYLTEPELFCKKIRGEFNLYMQIW